MPVASSQATNQRALAQQNRPMHAAAAARRAPERAPARAALRRTCGGGENELGGLLRVERIATNSDIFVLVDLQWVADLSAPGLAPTRRAGPASPLPAGGRWRERPSAHCWRAAWRCASSPVAAPPRQGRGATTTSLPPSSTGSAAVTSRGSTCAALCRAPLQASCRLLLSQRFQTRPTPRPINVEHANLTPGIRPYARCHR